MKTETPVERLINHRPTWPPRFRAGQQVRTKRNTIGRVMPMRRGWVANPDSDHEEGAIIYEGDSARVRDDYGIYAVEFERGAVQFWRESDLAECEA